MARTAFTAPAHTILQRSPGSYNVLTSSVSPDAAPSLCYGGSGLLDHRLPYNKYNSAPAGVPGAGAMCIGWSADSEVVVLDYTIPAASTTNIAVAANAVAGVPMVLVTSSGAGIIVTTAPFTSLPFGNTIPTGSLAIGSVPVYLKMGMRDITAFYDPLNALALVVQITGSASSTGVNFTVRGFDYYGQAMSEQIAGPAGATSQNGKKAWKWITSVTPATSDAHTYSVGTTLIAGLNVACDFAGYFLPYVNGAGYTTNPTIVAADTTNPATLTTGDVRGTTILTAVRNILYVTPSAARLTQSPLATGLFGVPNFAN